MAYRETDWVRERKEGVRDAILKAARGLVAQGGYRAAQMSEVARAAGLATGTLYRYFPSKAALFAEVFRSASQHEVEVFAAAAGSHAGHAARLRAALERFAERALQGRQMAWALLAEPVDPAVEAERLVYRRAYARVLEGLLRDGIAAGAFAAQNPAVTAAALVGAIGEVLTGPLSPTTGAGRPGRPGHAELIESLVNFALRAVGAQEPEHASQA